MSSSHPNSFKNHLVAMLGEFVGTFLFLFAGFSGTQVANMRGADSPEPTSGDPDPTSIIFISLTFGASLAANAWAFYRVTGGLFNPVVTLALAACHGFPWLRAAFIIPAQMLGGIAAAGVVYGLFPGPMSVGTSLGGGASIAQGLFIEVFFTAQLVFIILMLAVEKHKTTPLAPIGIGLTFFLCEICSVYFTGGSLNPARSFGPAVVNGDFPGHHWIYWLGPILGSFMAVGFYEMLRFLRWEECNPGQDDDGEALDSVTSRRRSGSLRNKPNGVGV